MKKYLLFSLLLLPALTFAYSERDIFLKTEEMHSLIAKVKMDYTNHKEIDDKITEMVHHCAEYHKSVFMRDVCNKIIEDQRDIIAIERD